MSIETEEQAAAISIEPERKRRFARRKFSAFERVAFWVSFLRMLGGMGGIVALTVSQGAPSRDIVTTAIVSLAIVVILATKVRWAPIVTSFLSGYLLLLTFTQPFALEDLGNPKGPDGFVLFCTAVLAFAFSLLVFGGSLGASIQNYRYRPENRRTPRWLATALGVVAGMIIGALFIGAMAQPASPGGMTYTNGVPTVHIAASGFLQSSISISKGSSVLLVNDTTVEHDLANGIWQNGQPSIESEPGAPFLNNVPLVHSSLTIGPFSTAGTYHIMCTIHRGMELTIIVQ